MSPDGLLGYISPEQYQEHASDNQSGSPAFFVADVSGLWLFPTPNSEQTVKVTAYRQFADWPLSNADEPDLGRGFDEVICWYMLSKYYSAQEDLELAETYMREYEVTVAHQIEGALRTSAITAGPRIFGNQSVNAVQGPERVSRIVV
jgi:hypothetical protein